MARSDPAAADDVSDALLGGRVRLAQSRSGYRAAIDPVLLAAAVPARRADRVLDLGTGAGAAALCLAARVAGCHLTGLEVDEGMAALAAENAAANGFGEWIEIVVGDLLDPPAALARRTFDHVLANPPYLRAAEADPSPHRERARATVEGAAGLEQWIRFALAKVRPGGTVTFIHRLGRLAELLAGLSPRAGGIVVFPLWPGEGRDAKRVIAQATKGSRAPLRLSQGLVLHGPDGYTEAAEAVLREAAPLML